MKIGFENKSVSAFDKVYDETVRIRDSAESVIPDTKPDVAGIVSVQKSVYLKSKDVTGRGVSITGEARADIIYICEGEQQVSAHTITKSFIMEYDIPDIDLVSVPIIALTVDNTQVRIVNPRKLAVSFAVSGHMECYSPAQIMTQQVYSDDAPLHLRREERQQLYTSWAGEKTFAVNEQFALPEGSRAVSICSRRLNFTVTDKQCVGTKLLVKGMVQLSISYLAENTPYPINTEFATPYSQLIETNTDSIAGFDVGIEPTSMFVEITQGISGECALDCEIHAVMQAAGYSEGTVTYFADAYSNRSECSCTCRDVTLMCEKRAFDEPRDVQQTLELPEDCADVLCIMSALNEGGNDESGHSAALDVLYETSDGHMSAVHRSVELGKFEGEYLMTRMQTDFEDKKLILNISGHSKCVQSVVETVEILESIDLAEDMYDSSDWPSLYAVRTEKESLWELAKTYHSSIERITAANEDVTDIRGKVLLIPKE